MKSFQLKNIKSFKDTGEIELKPITVFVGKNSSGKSSLVRFPVVLAQTFLEDTISPIVFNGISGKYLDYGNFEDVVFGHEGDEVEFKLKYYYNDIRNIVWNFRTIGYVANINNCLRYLFKHNSLVFSQHLNVG